MTQESVVRQPWNIENAGHWESDVGRVVVSMPVRTCLQNSADMAGFRFTLGGPQARICHLPDGSRRLSSFQLFPILRVDPVRGESETRHVEWDTTVHCRDLRGDRRRAYKEAPGTSRRNPAGVSRSSSAATHHNHHLSSPLPFPGPSYLVVVPIPQVGPSRWASRRVTPCARRRRACTRRPRSSRTSRHTGSRWTLAPSLTNVSLTPAVPQKKSPNRRRDPMDPSRPLD